LTTHALIFIPPDQRLDSADTAQSVQHARRRDYRLVAVLQEWRLVEQLLSADAVQVVVFAHNQHDSGPTWPTAVLDLQKIRLLNGRASRPEIRPALDDENGRRGTRSRAEQFLDEAAERWARDAVNWHRHLERMAGVNTDQPRTTRRWY
jgi:hypothetical protein